MRLLLQRKAEQLAKERALEQNQEWIKQHSHALRIFCGEYTKVDGIKIFYASCRIQGLIRGFLARVHFKQLKNKHRAVVLIQKIGRGYLGKRRAHLERWKRICCVPTKYALKLLKERSKMIRKEGDWVEYFDKETGQLWYYNMINMNNVWEPPKEFFSHLICPWDRLAYPFNNPNEVVLCRKVFGHVSELQTHLNTAHSFICPSCHLNNKGGCFPICSVCGQSVTNQGENLKSLIPKTKFRSKMLIKKLIIKANAKQGVDTTATSHKFNNGGEDKKSSRSSTNEIPQTIHDILAKVLLKEEEMGFFERSFDDDTIPSTSLPPISPSPNLTNTRSSFKSSTWDAFSQNSSTFSPSNTMNEWEDDKTEGDYDDFLFSTNQQGTFEQEGLLFETFWNTLTSSAFHQTIDGKESSNQRKKSSKKDEEHESKAASLYKHPDYLHPPKQTIMDGFEMEYSLEEKDQKEFGLLNKTQNSSSQLFPPIFTEKTRYDYSTSESGNLEEALRLTMLEDDQNPTAPTALTLYREDTIERRKQWEECDKEEELMLGIQDEMDSDEEEEEEEGGSTILSKKQKRELEERRIKKSMAKWKRFDDKLRSMNKMRVCTRFMRKKCFLSTCPLAHPHLRDNAKIEMTEDISSNVKASQKLRKYAVVSLCDFWVESCGDCDHGKDCEKYHSYVRPTTDEIIANIYPLDNGIRRKRVGASAEFYGEVRGGRRHGTGEMRWDHGSYFKGEFKDDMRDGLGVFLDFSSASAMNTTCPSLPSHISHQVSTTFSQMGRYSIIGVGDVTVDEFAISSFGEEGGNGSSLFATTGSVLHQDERGDMRSIYIGEYKDDKREGHGIWKIENGEEYVGEFKDGLMEGEGILQSKNGDVYRGMWARGKFHGMGKFEKKNGDDYLGEFKNGKCEGRGLLTIKRLDAVYEDYHNFIHYKDHFYEKYKGTFKDNFRDGKGLMISIPVKVRVKEDEDDVIGKNIKDLFDPTIQRSLKIRRLDEGYEEKKEEDSHFQEYWMVQRYSGNFYRDKFNGFGILHSAYYHSLHDLEHGDVQFEERYVGDFRMGKMSGVGRIVFRNLDFYDGSFRADLPHGKGVYYFYKERNIYSGDMKKGKFSGRGMYKFGNGSSYEGEFASNYAHGRGVMKLVREFVADGDRVLGLAKYKGNFAKSMKHGKGIYQWENGNVYKGIFEFDSLQGFGEMVYNTSGHRYVGEWNANKKEGQGTFYYSDGNVYDGMWYKDMKHGEGIMVYNPGSVLQERYEGGWLNDKKHGFGAYQYKANEGTSYEGMWEGGLRHGKGILKFKDGSYYKGDLTNEKMHGFGCFVWPDGSQYEGDWKDNQRHGYGTYLGTDGSIFKGEFVKNRMHGKGEKISANGDAYIGVWDNDIIMGDGSYVLVAGKLSEKDMKEILESEDKDEELPDDQLKRIRIKVKGY